MWRRPAAPALLLPSLWVALAWVLPVGGTSGIYQALFWLGQKNAAPLGDLLALYPRLDGQELREHFVFVLSQRHETAAVDKLIDLARNDTDREIRAKATFWLGQSRDPRAARFLEERIAK